MIPKDSKGKGDVLVSHPLRQLNGLIKIACQCEPRFTSPFRMKQLCRGQLQEGDVTRNAKSNRAHGVPAMSLHHKVHDMRTGLNDAAYFLKTAVNL